MGWESHAVTIADPAEKARAVAAAIGLLTSSADACRAAGLPVDIVSCGGTGTFPYCAQQPGVTEIQAGGAIFSDMHYRTHYHLDIPAALTLLATVTSRPTATRVIIDAGKKTMSSDAAVPMPLGVAAKRVALSAEHGTIELAEPSDLPRIGDKLELIVGYSDTTVHLHEEIVAVRNGRIEAIWRVAGRGTYQVATARTSRPMAGAAGRASPGSASRPAATRCVRTSARSRRADRAGPASRRPRRAASRDDRTAYRSAR